MRILIYSNAPWAGSGYGTQTAQLARRLKADGHEVAIANNFGLAATDSEWEGIPVFATGYDAHSRDVIAPYAVAWQADWVLTLYDVWPLHGVVPPELRVASWTPVDADPAPPAVVQWAKDHLTIAMSRFGQEALRAAGVDARYAPHAIDADIYHPRQSDARERMGIPEDAFLVFINAANKGQPPRKAWPEMLQGFAAFQKRHDDVYLLLNTEMDGMIGLPLAPLLVACGVPENRLRVVPQFEYKVGRISSAHVAALYSTADVLLSTSMGEGFGLSVIESQACGTPVIVTDFTAQPELVGSGWTVGYQKTWHSGQNTWWATPDVGEITEALEGAYKVRGNTEIRRQAVEFAADYEADKVYDTYWRPILSEMEAALEPPQPKRKGKSNAARRRAKKVAA